ncbi:c-type cytochrome [Telmatospirillum siberiense]|nr:c-type cytochrome [Telmatospirillum siberiense]
MMMKLNALFLPVAVCGLLLAGAAMAADPAASCAGCHGPDGNSTDSSMPSIAGASVAYLSGTLNEYKSKQRPCSEVAVLAGEKKGTKTDMCKLVADLSAADIDALAKTFSAKKFVRFKQEIDPALAAKGKTVHDAQCEKCHSEGGSVAEDDAGILAGQPLAYLKTQLADYKSGKRPAPSKMQPKISPLQPADLDALAAYYASLK